MWETICQFSLLVPLVAYFSIRYYYNYWQRKKIPCVESNILNFDWFTLPTIEYTAKIYRLLDSHKFGGCYPQFAPKLMIRDPELIKRVLNDDFECFCDRGYVTFDENVPMKMHVFGAPSIFSKNSHENFAPLFTSDRMEFLFDLIKECSRKLAEVVSHETKMDEVIDMKDLSDGYAIEVILRIFGLKTHSTIPNGKPLFESMTSKIFHSSWITKLSILIYSVSPKLGKIFEVFSTNNSAYEYFFKTVEETVTYREKNDVNRNDFLQLLIDLRKNEKEVEMTNEMLAVQCCLFSIVGYKSISMTLKGALFELAANPRVQERLQVEIDSYLRKFDGKVTSYEMVENMPFLQQVFSETVRKYPVLGTLNRACVVDYQIPGTEVIIEKGTEILIPVSGLHWDVQYFPNPEIFDPDRFEDLSKLPCRDAYLPFGDGSKNYIGSRFASISVKLALIYLLRDFRFEICSKTRHPLEFECNEIFTAVNREIFLKCCKK